MSSKNIENGSLSLEEKASDYLARLESAFGTKDPKEIASLFTKDVSMRVHTYLYDVRLLCTVYIR